MILTSILGFVPYLGQIRIAYMLVLLCILIHTRIDIIRNYNCIDIVAPRPLLGTKLPKGFAPSFKL
jgi:hypothetical protein